MVNFKMCKGYKTMNDTTKKMQEEEITNIFSLGNALKTLVGSIL